jgi:hypothetical protein
VSKWAEEPILLYTELCRSLVETLNGAMAARNRCVRSATRTLNGMPGPIKEAEAIQLSRMHLGKTANDQVIRPGSSVTPLVRMADEPTAKLFFISERSHPCEIIRFPHALIYCCRKPAA